MANSLTPFNPEIWAKITQAYLKKSLVSSEVASTKEEGGTLKAGDTVNRPYKSDFTVSSYTNNTDITATDITATNEQLTINSSKAIRIKIDPVEDTQSTYDVFKEYAPRMAYRLRDNIDQAVLTNITSANVSVDEGDFGGTSGGAIDLATYKPKSVFGRAYGELIDNQVETDLPICLVVDPITLNDIQQDFITDGFSSADATLKNGFVGNSFLGMNTYVSHNLPSSVSLGLATVPTADDTITIKGVTWTFVASPATAGDIDIKTTAALQVDAVVAAINGGSGAGSDYIEISTANRQKYTNNAVTATDNTTAVGLTAVGRINGSETFTDTEDGFGEETINCAIMQKGAIDLVTQMKPNVQVNKEPGNLGSSVIAHTLYGVKLFAEGADRLCKVPVRANAATV